MPTVEESLLLESMQFGSWLQAEMSTEEKWTIEKIARKEEPRTAMLYRLCCQQQFQLQQAVNEIARLELLLMDHSNS